MQLTCRTGSRRDLVGSEEGMNVSPAACEMPAGRLCRSAKKSRGCVGRSDERHHYLKGSSIPRHLETRRYTFWVRICLGTIPGKYSRVDIYVDHRARSTTIVAVIPNDPPAECDDVLQRVQANQVQFEQYAPRRRGSRGRTLQV